jgi:3-oxoadipate enol-lactonase
LKGIADVPGGRLYYEVDGDGPALTLIHAGVAHLRMWDEQVAAFAERYRVIRYDTRGFGRTTTDDVVFSNRSDLLALLDHLGVERTHLLGASRGGTIAIDFTLEHPSRVSSLIVVAAGVGGHELDEPEMEETWTEVEQLEEGGDWPALVELETRIWTDGVGQPPDRVGAEVRRRMLEWNLQNYEAEQPANQPRPLDPPAVGRLAEISVPTLVCWGTLDVSSVPVSGEYILANVGGPTRRHVFDGVAHMVNLERPAEFNRLVLDFLAEVEASASTQ